MIWRKSKTMVVLTFSADWDRVEVVWGNSSTAGNGTLALQVGTDSVE
jgi:hypothetical protein